MDVSEPDIAYCTKKMFAILRFFHLHSVFVGQFTLLETYIVRRVGRSVCAKTTPNIIPSPNWNNSVFLSYF